MGWELSTLGDCLDELYRYPTYYGIKYVSKGVPEIRGELIEEDGTLEKKGEAYRYIDCKTAEIFPKVRLEAQDFVLSVRGTVGKVGMVPEQLSGAVITANLIRLKFNKSLIWPKWARHFLLSAFFQNQLEAITSATTIKTIQVPKLRSIALLRPPIHEQLQIAKILDTVDEAIQRTEQLIAKLKAIKQGLLHDLLTRGLDENGQLRDPIAHPEQFKDSTLGRIPKEWEVYRINEIGKVVSGTTPSRMVPQYWGGTIPWITPTDMSKLTNDYISGGQDSITQSGLESCSANLLPIGSIVVTTRATLGLTAVTERELATNQGFKNIIPNDGWNSLFLCYKIHELSNEMIKRASGTTFLEISGTQFILLEITAPVPGSKEQSMIANAISVHNQRIEKEEQYLAKLKLLKKGLMHDLLTGKVGVRIDDGEGKEYTLKETTEKIEEE
ncbi:MAG: restriction endonuclease subunit S [Syntrophaceae bacterium]|nr:restriction endonuclease subunit S [Syntrophaceae bacterium]